MQVLSYGEISSHNGMSRREWFESSISVRWSLTKFIGFMVFPVLSGQLPEKYIEAGLFIFQSSYCRCWIRCVKISAVKQTSNQ